MQTEQEQQPTRRFAIRGWDVVRVALGLLLLAAAGLKLAGRNVSAVPTIGWFGQPWVQLAVIEWELSLGVWLLSGWFPAGSWLAAIGTFTAFAGVSGYLGWAGSCELRVLWNSSRQSVVDIRRRFDCGWQRSNRKPWCIARVIPFKVRFSSTAGAQGCRCLCTSTFDWECTAHRIS